MKLFKPIMIVGTSSNAGKTTLVAGLSRLFSNQNIKTAPFKSQNMSLNSYVTILGEEIARSIAVQAFAARQEPNVHMNPILLKPNNDTTSQVILHGKAECNLDAKEYFKSEFWYDKKKSIISQSIDYLRKEYELIIAEGAGSCAEPNFRFRDLVNMGLAHLLNADVYLVVDIDKGGVFADILGTLRVMELTYPNDKELIKGFIINKFRGDKDLLQPAIAMIEKETKIPVVGVIPYLHFLTLEEEDSLKEEACQEPEIDIAIIYLPHLSNSSDFNPLKQEKGVRLRFIKSKEELGAPDLIIIPGTKNTLWDLDYIRKIGLESAIMELQPFTPLIGICGGLEMMGKTIQDPFQVESDLGTISGMNLCDFEVVLSPKKIVRQVTYLPTLDNIFKSAGEIQGYEVHCGELKFGKRCTPLHYSEFGVEGVIKQDKGLIIGTFIHDVFKNPRFTRMLINYLREKRGLTSLEGPFIDPSKIREMQYDKLALEIEQSCVPLLQQFACEREI